MESKSDEPAGTTDSHHSAGRDSLWVSAQGSIEPTTKILGLAALLLYVIGLLVRNLYLATLGFTDFTVLRVNSIFTGVWCALFVFVAVLPLAGLHGFLKTQAKHRWWKALASFLGFSYMTLYGLKFLLRVLAPEGELPDLSDFPIVGTAEEGLLVLLGANVLIFLFLETGLDKREATLYERLSHASAAFPTWIVLALLGLSLLFPHIEPQFGGGYPIPTALMLSDEGKKVWHRLHSDYNDAIDPVVQVVDENEATFVVTDSGTQYDGGNRTTVVLDKKLVLAFVPKPSAHDKKPPTRDKD